MGRVMVVLIKWLFRRGTVLGMAYEVFFEVFEVFEVGALFLEVFDVGTLFLEVFDVGTFIPKDINS